jgi:antirestriction protein ArdC
LVHAVGHPSQLRATLTDLCLFGDPTYQGNRGQMGAAYLCGVCGIASTIAWRGVPQSWMAVLRHDATLLVHAAAQTPAADYIQNLQPDTGLGRAFSCRTTGALYRPH